MKKQVANPYLPSRDYILDGEARAFCNKSYIF